METVRKKKSLGEGSAKQLSVYSAAAVVVPAISTQADSAIHVTQPGPLFVTRYSLPEIDLDHDGETDFFFRYREVKQTSYYRTFQSSCFLSIEGMNPANRVQNRRLQKGEAVVATGYTVHSY